MKIGLALGSGSARGWSHIGVIRALAAQGIHPDIICGTSIGSLVGASYAFNNLDALEGWILSLSRLDIARFFNISRSLKGLVDVPRLHQFLAAHVAADDINIEHCLDKRYAAVATDLDSGREVWLTEGAVLDAVWASIALPGLFPAIRHQERWLVDGGLVNPVPVSVCRALGADVVIAVNLNGSLLGNKPLNPQPVESPTPVKRDASDKPAGIINRLSDMVTEYTTGWLPERTSEVSAPNLFESIAGSVNITQDRITRSRMAGDPPDILLAPKLADIGLLEFHRAAEAIEEGRLCVQRMLPEIDFVFQRHL